MFSECSGYSPVTSQDFIWLGEYVDGTHLSEFDFQTKKENSFYALQRDKLIRFGLIGHGNKLYFETDGTFKLSGRRVDLVYSTPEKDFLLTGNVGHYYNDIITYKDAEASGLANYSPLASGEGGRLSNTITMYNFGYKASLNINDVIFHLKVICKIPYHAPAYMAIKLVANQKLDGQLLIKVNGFTSHEVHAPLEENIGGELNWIIQ